MVYFVVAGYFNHPFLLFFSLYHINKEKLTFVLEKLSNGKVDEREIEELMRKFQLYDESFLRKVNRI